MDCTRRVQERLVDGVNVGLVLVGSMVVTTVTVVTKESLSVQSVLVSKFYPNQVSYHHQ